MMICIVSEDISKNSLKSIRKFTNKIVLIRKYPVLYSAVSSHADIQCFPLDKKRVLVHPELNRETVDELKDAKLEVIFGNSKLGRNYPEDIPYNVAQIGDKIIHNTLYMDEKLREVLQQRNCDFINVKQGYSKCSTLIVDDNSIITSDRGIAEKASQKNIDALLIRHGYIKLPGLNYGFIGGSAGNIKEQGIIIFNGDITLHPDYKAISAFIKEKGYSIHCLTEGILTDVGSIFFI